ADARAAMTDLCQRLDRLPPGAEERIAVEKYLERARLLLFSNTGAGPAAKALAEQMAGGGNTWRERLLTEAVTNWASRNLADARAWGESLPEGPARERALTGVASGWASSSISEVAAWINALPSSPSRNAAVDGFARVGLPRDPAGALEWLRTITHAETRLKTLRSAWSEWHWRNPEQAVAWRDNSVELTSAERAHLR
ncbi:MAG: hypothetical protein M3463_09195, partial [Verrucomicrobiota bacterium]|nr:hypothetical protein [Verrucomicrobiota bacterium]